MNKRGLFVLGILVLLGLSYGVYSTIFMNIGEGSEEGIVDISITEGWNLVPFFTPDKLIGGDVLSSDIVAVFAYIPEENKYYESYPDNTLFLQYLASSPYADPTSAASARLNMASVWVYTNNAGSIRYIKDVIPDSKNVLLKTGWNFVYITPDMAGKTLDGMNGNCSYRRAYFYQENAWQSLLANGMDEVISPENVGTGFLVNVRRDCVMSKDPIVPPAQTCTDTDEGDDQNTKGTVRVSLSGAVTSYTDSCSGNVLTEYYCNANINLSKQYTCANGCSNGACVSAPTVIPIGLNVISPIAEKNYRDTIGNFTVNISSSGADIVKYSFDNGVTNWTYVQAVNQTLPNGNYVMKVYASNAVNFTSASVSFTISSSPVVVIPQPPALPVLVDYPVLDDNNDVLDVSVYPEDSFGFTYEGKEYWISNSVSGSVVSLNVNDTRTLSLELDQMDSLDLNSDGSADILIMLTSLGKDNLDFKLGLSSVSQSPLYKTDYCGMAPGRC